MKTIIRLLFVQPAKTSPLDYRGYPMQKIRANMSVAAATVLGALQSIPVQTAFLDLTAEGMGATWMVNQNVMASGLTDEQFVERVEVFRPDVLLITSMFTSEQFMVDRLVRTAKQRFPGVLVVVGGIHASVRPQWHFDNAAPDFVVVGEGEETIIELLQELAKERPEPAKVRGLVYRNSAGDLVRTGHRGLIRNLSGNWALDKVLRKPDGWNRYPDTACRKGPVYRNTEDPGDAATFVLFGSRGCPQGCGYCASTPRTGREIRHMGEDSMFRQFLAAREEFGIGVFANQADTFGEHQSDLVFLRMISDYRRATGDRAFVLNNPNAFFVSRFFNGGPRPQFDEDFLALLGAAGFNVVTLAVETTCQRFNRKVNFRRITPDHVLGLARLIKGYGLGLDVYMMYGFPEQEVEEFSADLRFGQRMAEVADSVTWHKLSLLPGTEFYDRYILDRGLETAYRAYLALGKGSCFFDCDELNLSHVGSGRFRDAVAEFGRGWL